VLDLVAAIRLNALLGEYTMAVLEIKQRAGGNGDNQLLFC
jgi:hypothetical protein